MRILYLDLDSTRPDHLGCYGYHRNTSPTIDRIAAEGVCFDHCYCSDAPCLPSRTALFSGRNGFQTGVVGHGGRASIPFLGGAERGFKDRFNLTSWPALLRQQGYRTAAISPFGERHSAWHWYAGFNEVINTGKTGSERADEVWPFARDWFERHAEEDDWFLHLNFWDPHTSYRTPAEYGEPFADDPLPAWLDEPMRQHLCSLPGQNSAQEIRGHWSREPGWDAYVPGKRQPLALDSMHEVRMMFDGYDTAIRYLDDHIAKILALLDAKGVLDDTAIIISADHGENLGELNVCGDHSLADHLTCHVPCIIRWPGVTDRLAGQHLDDLIYHFDFAATSIDLVGGAVPDDWDGASFAARLRGEEETAQRDHLVLSQAAWTPQRAVRWERWICIQTYHDCLRCLPEFMLFDLESDPHELHNLARERPEVVDEGMRLLARWQAENLRRSPTGVDPMGTVLAEGGSYHFQEALKPGERNGQMMDGMEHLLGWLRASGRARWAANIEARHSRDPVSGRWRMDRLPTWEEAAFAGGPDQASTGGHA